MEKIRNNQKITYFKKLIKNLNNKKLNYVNTKIEKIRVIKGTNFDYFSEEGKKFFF